MIAAQSSTNTIKLLEHIDAQERILLPYVAWDTLNCLRQQLAAQASQSEALETKYFGGIKFFEKQGLRVGIIDFGCKRLLYLPLTHHGPQFFRHSFAQIEATGARIFLLPCHHQARHFCLILCTNET
jgi:hypothetical protein